MIMSLSSSGNSNIHIPVGLVCVFWILILGSLFWGKRGAGRVQRNEFIKGTVLQGFVIVSCAASAVMSEDVVISASTWTGIFLCAIFWGLSYRKGSRNKSKVEDGEDK